MSSLTGKVKLLMVTAAISVTALGVGVAGDGGSGSASAPAPVEATRPLAALAARKITPPPYGGSMTLPEGKAVDTGVKFRMTPTDEFGTVWLQADKTTVVGPTPATVRAIAHEAEFQWKEQSERWRWQRKTPAKPLLTIGWKNEGSSSAFDFMVTPTGHHSATIRLHGSLQSSLEDQLPRQITHVILFSRLGPNVPVWAILGAGSTAVSWKAQTEFDQRCRELLEQGQGIRLAVLFRLFVYSGGSKSWEAQSHSVTRFLLDRPILSKTKLPPNAHRQRFLQFVQSGTKNGWDQAAKEFYGFANVSALEEAWIAWLKTPESRLAPARPRPPVPAKPAELQHIPPVKLSGGR